MCRHRIGFARLMGPQRLHQSGRVMCPGGRAGARQGNLRLTPSLRAGVRRGAAGLRLIWQKESAPMRPMPPHARRRAGDEQELEIAFP
jgi:hypothetical protein